MTDDRARIAAELYADRRERDRIFGDARDGFGEPGWDMLLRLYVAEAGGRAPCEDALLSDAGVERALAEPFLLWLCSFGLCEVGGGEDPARRTVRLQERGRAMMELYLDRRQAPAAPTKHG